MEFLPTKKSTTSLHCWKCLFNDSSVLFGFRPPMNSFRGSEDKSLTATSVRYLLASNETRQTDTRIAARGRISRSIKINYLVTWGSSIGTSLLVICKSGRRSLICWTVTSTSQRSFTDFSSSERTEKNNLVERKWKMENANIHSNHSPVSAPSACGEIDDAEVAVSITGLSCFLS